VVTLVRSCSVFRPATLGAMSTSNPKRLRQSPRLGGFAYVGTYVYNLGTVTRGRLPLIDPATASDVADSLGKACAKYSFTCYAYSFMPDHVHLLVASEDGASMERFMRYFKQISGYAYKKRTGRSLWQISYYDHVLRAEEAVRPIAEYIWQNPVRRGLVDSPEKYPYGPKENMAL
jgi:putative transposase